MADQYAYRVLIVRHDGESYVLSDWGLHGAEQSFDSADGMQVALTERGQEGWRLCQYTPAPDGWPAGVYVLEHLGPTPRPHVPTLEEQLASQLRPDELERLAGSLEDLEEQPVI